MNSLYYKNEIKIGTLKRKKELGFMVSILKFYEKKNTGLSVYWPL